MSVKLCMGKGKNNDNTILRKQIKFMGNMAKLNIGKC